MRRSGDLRINLDHLVIFNVHNNPLEIPIYVVIRRIDAHSHIHDVPLEFRPQQTLDIDLRQVSCLLVFCPTLPELYVPLSTVASQLILTLLV